MEWPDHFTTDGAGNAYIPALEVGEHTIHVNGDDNTHRIKADEPSAELPKPQEIHLPERR
jgi:hypothetical protein